MLAVSKLKTMVAALCLIAVSAGTARSQSADKTPAPRQTGSQNQAVTPYQGNAATDNSGQEEPEEELAPAALQLNDSKFSPLAQKLYQATRETKEQAILAQLADAKQLLESGADVKAVDAQGRTALHWAVFGSSYNTKPKIVVAYEEIADALIHHGVEINREDIYQDTALDYLLYSPNFEMQTLLIENGASSGFLAAFYHFFEQTSEDIPRTHSAAVARSRTADLTPGMTLSVRLDVPVYSDGSRTGDPIEATVTYPLCKNGEQVQCNEGELIVPPGAKLDGTVLFAQKAPDKYSRPRLVLDFSNVVHKGGQRSPLYARVLDVDNARETIRNNEIFGIVQPHAATKVSIAMAAISASTPYAGYTIKGVQAIYGLSIRREVLFPAGTDIQLQIVRPSILKQKELWAGWQRIAVTPQLQQVVATAPLRTSTPSQTPSDPTNLMFLGTRDQLLSAFGEAGWIRADDLNVKSAIKAAQATIRQTGYSEAPVSSLLLEGRQPDLVFQKSLDTFAKRHHLRVWKLGKTYDGREVWVGAATHDIATTRGRAGTKWSHRIDPHIDRERDWVSTDLLFIGTATAYADVDRPSAPRKLSNATGDVIVTDGKMSVLMLAGVKQPNGEVLPQLQPRETTQH